MRQAKNNSIMHKIQLKRTNKSFNKIAKQQIIIKNIRDLVPADNEEMNFLHENILPKDLKSKDQLQASRPSHDWPFMTFSYF